MSKTIFERLEDSKDMRAIDFYQTLKEGDVFSFPIDDSALCMYDITVGDMLDYMKSGAEKKHWSIILKEVLDKKGLLQ